jgi:hypothetical protein
MVEQDKMEDKVGQDIIRQDKSRQRNVPDSRV